MAESSDILSKGNLPFSFPLYRLSRKEPASIDGGFGHKVFSFGNCYFGSSTKETPIYSPLNKGDVAIKTLLNSWHRQRKGAQSIANKVFLRNCGMFRASIAKQVKQMSHLGNIAAALSYI